MKLFLVEDDKFFIKYKAVADYIELAIDVCKRLSRFSLRELINKTFKLKTETAIDEFVFFEMACGLFNLMNTYNLRANEYAHLQKLNDQCGETHSIKDILLDDKLTQPFVSRSSKVVLVEDHWYPEMKVERYFHCGGTEYEDIINGLTLLIELISFRSITCLLSHKLFESGKYEFPLLHVSLMSLLADILNIDTDVKSFADEFKMSFRGQDEEGRMVERANFEIKNRLCDACKMITNYHFKKHIDSCMDIGHEL